MCKTFSTLRFILELQSLYIKKWKVLIHNTFHLNYLEIIFAIKLPLQQPAPLISPSHYEGLLKNL